MSEPRNLSTAAMIRLVAAREITARIRDKNFLISSAVILVLLIGTLGLQVALNSGSEPTRIGVVGDAAQLQPALEAQGAGPRCRRRGRRAGRRGRRPSRRSRRRRSTASCSPRGTTPSCWSSSRRAASLQAVVQGAVAQLSITEQLSAAGVDQPRHPGGVGPRARPGRRPGRAAGGRRDHRRRRPLRTADPLRPVRRPGGGGGEVQPGRRAAAGHDEARGSSSPGRSSGSGCSGWPRSWSSRWWGSAGALAFDLVDIPGDLIGTAVPRSCLVRAGLRLLRGDLRRGGVAGQPAGGPRRRHHADDAGARRRPSSSGSRPRRTPTAPSPSSPPTCRGSRPW